MQNILLSELETLAYRDPKCSIWETLSFILYINDQPGHLHALISVLCAVIANCVVTDIGYDKF